jgi:hypothetical protein
MGFSFPPVLERFEQSYIPEPNSGCWLWLGYSPNGRYGAIRWRGKRVLAHIVSYKLFRGRVRKGHVVDHLCHNTFCVNPDHLETKTQLENMRNSKAAIKTHCVHGHPYADGWVHYYRSDRFGVRYRRCLTCYRMKYPGTKQ